MTFGPYAKGECFYIEKSKSYQRVQDGLKMAEFLLLRQQKDKPVIWVIEAKSSTPCPGSQPRFTEFIDEIRSKFTHGFLLFLAVRLKRHQAGEKELPDKFIAIDLSALDFRFVLVINGHKKEWLPPLNDALSKALKPLLRVWALSANSVSVLNHEWAREQGLIKGPVHENTTN